jgi:hypothetical protein
MCLINLAGLFLYAKTFLLVSLSLNYSLVHCISIDSIDSIDSTDVVPTFIVARGVTLCSKFMKIGSEFVELKFSSF